MRLTENNLQKEEGENMDAQAVEQAVGQAIKNWRESTQRQ